MSVQLALYRDSKFFYLIYLQDCNYILKVIVKGLSLLRSGHKRVRKNIKTFLDLFFPNIKNTERETLQNDSFVTSQLKKLFKNPPNLTAYNQINQIGTEPSQELLPHIGI